MARSRPSDDGRKPLGRTTAPNASVRLGVPAQRPALCERWPRHPSTSFNRWEVHTSQTHKREERQNRRASGTAAGVKAGCDERWRSEQTVFSPVTGDHQIACRSAVGLQHHVSSSASLPLRLCVSAFFFASGSSSICVICGLSGSRWLCDLCVLGGCLGWVGGSV